MSVRAVGMQDVPQAILGEIFTFLNPPALTSSSRVCKLWQKAAQSEIHRYKEQEIWLRYTVFTHIFSPYESIIQADKVEYSSSLNSLRKLFPLIFNSKEFDISKQIIPLRRQKQTKKGVFSFFQSTFEKLGQFFSDKKADQKELNFYSTFQSCIDNLLSTSKGKYIICDFRIKDLSSRFFQSAFTHYNKIYYPFAYVNDLLFRSRLESSIGSVKQLCISRGACDHMPAWAHIKKSLSVQNNLRTFVFYCSHGKEVKHTVQSSPFEELGTIFQSFSIPYGVFINSFHLNSKDVCGIANMIQKSPLSYLFISNEDQLNREDFECIAQALAGRTREFLFVLRYENSEGIQNKLQPLQSLVGTNPDLQIDLKPMIVTKD